MKNYLKIAGTLGMLAFVVVLQAQSSDALPIEQASSLKVSTVPLPFAKTITKSDLEKHLTIIASDEFEGRENRNGRK